MEITKEDIIFYKKYIKSDYKEQGFYVGLSSKSKECINKTANTFSKELKKYSESYSIRNAYLFLDNYIIALFYEEKYEELNKIIYGIGYCVDAIDDMNKQLKRYDKIIKKYYKVLNG